LLIRHSKYSAMLSKIQKYTPTDCFFRDFAHWEKMDIHKGVDEEGDG